MQAKVTKKHTFNIILNDALETPLDSSIEAAPENTSKSALCDLYKDAQEGFLEIAIKGILEVALEVAFFGALVNTQECQSD